MTQPPAALRTFDRTSLREGWEIQNELTEAAAVREQRLAAVEGASRALAQLPGEEAIVVCLEQTVALAFAAATSRDHDATQPEWVSPF